LKKNSGTFEHAANGRINLHIIDPTPFSEDAYKAGLYGLRDQPGFFGLIGAREGQTAQRIESFNPENEPLLEYEISHLITQLLHPEPAIVGLLSGLPAAHPSSRWYWNCTDISTSWSWNRRPIMCPRGLKP